jgi:hypothetical protein
MQKVCNSLVGCFISLPLELTHFKIPRMLKVGIWGRAYMAGQTYNKAFEAYQLGVYRDSRSPTFWSVFLNQLIPWCNCSTTALAQPQATGAQLPAAPAPQDVHPTVYASMASTSGLGGLPLLHVNHSRCPVHRPDFCEPGSEVPHHPHTSAAKASPTPFRGAPHLLLSLTKVVLLLLMPGWPQWMAVAFLIVGMRHIHILLSSSRYSANSRSSPYLRSLPTRFGGNAWCASS